MKLTKFCHSCILVETPKRTALFDPGTMSSPLLKDHHLTYLDDIFITHKHPDHMDVPFIKKLVTHFSDVRVTAPADCLEALHDAGITQATDHIPDAVSPFAAPHEPVDALFGEGATPKEYGYHFMEMFSHPGDSHSFSETMPILALPVQAPWGSTTAAVELAKRLRPTYVIPIHDWHWSDEARKGMYDSLAQAFDGTGITFIKPIDAEPCTVEVS